MIKMQYIAFLKLAEKNKGYCKKYREKKNRNATQTSIQTQSTVFDVSMNLADQWVEEALHFSDPASNDSEAESHSDSYQSSTDEKTEEEPDETQSEEEIIEEIEINTSQKLYTGATLSLLHFNVLFMSLISSLNLSENHSNSLFEFIRLILPESNTLPRSYYLFKRSFNYNMINEIKLCHICKLKLKKSGCPSASCISKTNTEKENKKRSIKIVVANLTSQLKIILKRHYLDIINFKSN